VRRDAHRRTFSRSLDSSEHIPDIIYLSTATFGFHQLFEVLCLFLLMVAGRRNFHKFELLLKRMFGILFYKCECFLHFHGIVQLFYTFFY
jgi:hypothetical protein